MTEISSKLREFHQCDTFFLSSYNYRMKMEAHSSNSSCCDDDGRDLEQLLEAFGSMVSLKDIASAYRQAGHNIYTAGEILCNLLGSTSSTSTYASMEELEGANASSEHLSDDMLDKPNYAARNSIASKPKKCSVSIGTVSGVIGREYARTRPLTNESCKLTKPLKLNSKELPISEIWGEKAPPNVARDETMHKDVEEFLFTMLGDGFQLDKNVIQEVLGLCGYDVKKSMEKLLDISASTLEKSDDVVGIAAQNTMEKYSDLESSLCREKSHCMGAARSDKARSMTRRELESLKRDKDRYALQKEVLEALFNVPERVEEAPKRAAKEVRRSRVSGQVVVEPLKDTTTELIASTSKPQVIEDDEESEDSYEMLRKAVKEYWITMKEYYKVAVDAFAKGDHARAYKFLEEGHFFKKKAREADEKSAQKLLETRDDEEAVPLDLHEHEPKEAVHLLRLHLSNLSGIPSIQYLRVIIRTNDEDTKGGARRRLIIKLLERESIKWTEEVNGQILLIRVDEINPKCLSFAKKNQ
ncbi:hypothetical protein F0562_008930 [Nyssa sinensis]|uniref:DUF1771 domain-containing protein n=1 Tax=Nyssa sinensis TaxID=561372 RepID=A0A5J5AC43_9ASTE|nr:hypothetical protein F0562_008930 [Nyssa sinensis]